MSGVFNFSEEELLTFFAVLVRFSVLFAIMPIVGDRMVPAPVKILLALVVSMAIFPGLVTSGQIRPGEALAWGSTAGGIISTVALEAGFALVLGFAAKLAFDAILFGSNLIGTFMGLSMASSYDPHFETQTQTVSELQTTLAMLTFLALDGHHLLLRSALDSYRIVGLGGAGFGAAFAQSWLDMTAQVVRFGLQIAAPVAICIFAVNLAFGVMAKSMPQMNVLVLSFAVTSLVGLVVLLLSVPQFTGVAGNLFERSSDWMQQVMVAMGGKAGR